MWMWLGVVVYQGGRHTEQWYMLKITMLLFTLPKVDFIETMEWLVLEIFIPTFCIKPSGMTGSWRAISKREPSVAVEDILKLTNRNDSCSVAEESSELRISSSDSFEKDTLIKFPTRCQFLLASRIFLK